MQGRHCDVVLILLAHLECLLEYVFVADDAHVRIVVSHKLVWLLDKRLRLVYGHLLHHVCQELNSFVR